MNNISEQLLEAIDILADEKIKLLKFDKTVLATIYAVSDLNTGEYQVRYNGNIFVAYSENNDKVYSVDDNVYLKVPEGDFSNKKLITSLVSNKSLSEAEINNLSNMVFDVSPNFIVSTEGSPWGVVAGAESTEEAGGICNITLSNDYADSFKQYANNYEYIRLKASFLTQFYATHNQGNYGLKIVFNTANGETVSYALDLKNFNGSVYNFSTYAPQEIIILVQKKYLTGIASLLLFEENFDYDTYPRQSEDIESDKVMKKNIFVKDISLLFVDVKDLTTVNYYLTIVAPEGSVLKGTDSTLPLVGKLYCKGENITENSKCSFQWYKQDPTIKVGDTGYDKDAGFGWLKLEGETSATLTIGPNVDFLYSQKYKLIVNYNKETTLFAESEVLKKSASSGKDYSDCKIELSANGKKIYLTLKSSVEGLKGYWFYSCPDDSYIPIDEKEKPKELIEVSSYLKYSYVIFYCKVVDGELYVKTLQHTIIDSTDETDVNIKYTGEESFRYDANGDITIEDAEKNRTLLAEVIWKDGVATGYALSWLIGEEAIPDDKGTSLNPTNSMLEGLWVDTNNILHYNIRLKYRISYTNNIITIKITTISGLVYTFDKEVLFLKDGDLGTNGTTYVAAIRPCSSDGTKLSGLRAVIYNSGDGSIKDYLLKCYVYKDGELIENISSDNIKWTGNNIKFKDYYKPNSTSFTGIKTITEIEAPSYDTTTTTNMYYVKAEITVDGVVIYALYPINVLVTNRDGTKELEKIDIDDVPSYILYNSSGLSPSFYNNDLNFYYYNEEEKKWERLSNSSITSLSDMIKLEKKKDDDGKELLYLKPNSSFTFKESQIGVLQFKIDENNYLIHPIIMYLNTYGNEAINGWDGTKLTIDEENEKYIFAPLIGAGKKESSNKFTGIVMGEDSGLQQIGLYGYNEGKNTFGLKADGTAFFGLGELITINGDDATISGRTKENNGLKTFMTLCLNKQKDNDFAIKVGSSFSVDYDGVLTATSADISGKITADSGTIGGWEIGEDTITAKYGELSSITLFGSRNSGDNIAIQAGSNFSIGYDGTLTATGASITGNIDATSLKCKSGKIGGWKIDGSSLSGGDTILSSSGGITTNTLIIKMDKDNECKLGELAGMTVENNNYSTTRCFGFFTTSDKSIVLECSDLLGNYQGNIRLTAKNIYLLGTVHGVTAQFG